jgi:hypothetical protein
VLWMASPIARASITYCLLTRKRILLCGDTTWQHCSRGRQSVLRSVALRAPMHLSTDAISTGHSIASSISSMG